jgi:hypothetical protein
MAYSVFRVPNSITVLPTTGNQIVATIQGASGQSVDLQQWQDYLGNVISKIDNSGNHYGWSGIFSSNIAVNGGSISTSQTTANLFNTTATTVNIGGAGTTNANNFLATGTLGVSGVATFNSAINANNGTIATTATTANLLNTNATTINFGGAATTVNIGASNSNTYINGNLFVNGTTTSVNVTEIATSDFYLHLASGALNTGILNNAGIVLGSGAPGTGLGVKFTYDFANASWTSTENMNIAAGKVYKINGTQVLSSTGLGSTVVSSSLTGVGTLSYGVWNATTIGTGYTQAQVTSVTSANAGRISVGGTIQAPTVDLATVSQSTGSSFVKVTIDSYGRVTGNTAVTSGDIPNLNAGQITAGTLAVAQGGTNLSSYTTGDILYANGTTSIGKLSAVASGQFLVSNGTSTAPFYRNLTTPDITGALGYTPASSAGSVTGVGVSSGIAVWSSTNGLTYDTDLKYDIANNILTLGYGNFSASNADSSNISTNPSTPTQLDSFSATQYRAAKYIVVSKYGTVSQVSEALVVHDGSATAYVTEYGQMYTSGTIPLVNLTANYSAGTVTLNAYTTTGFSTITSRIMRFMVNA